MSSPLRRAVGLGLALSTAKIAQAQMCSVATTTGECDALTGCTETSSCRPPGCVIPGCQEVVGPAACNHLATAGDCAVAGCEWNFKCEDASKCGAHNRNKDACIAIAG